jgi:NAD-dependent deacetylase
MKNKLVVLTGAGISAESGIKTFRDSDGGKGIMFKM